MQIGNVIGLRELIKIIVPIKKYMIGANVPLLFHIVSLTDEFSDETIKKRLRYRCKWRPRQDQRFKLKASFKRSSYLLHR